MRRIVTVALVLATGIVMCAATAASAADLTVGHYRSATDSAASFPNVSWSASHEQVIDLQAWQTSRLQALKAANPNVKVLMYVNASAVSASPDSSGIYSTGVSYDQAKANGWLLQNTSGSPFTFNGYSWLWAADIGNAGYQQAWASNVIKELNAGPWDGVMLDDVNTTIKYHYCVTCVAQYPTDAAYSQAMGNFLSVVGPRIQAAGKLAVANIGSWAENESVGNSWLQYLSGAEDEMFLKWGSQAGSGYADPGRWANQLQEVKLSAAQHKLFIGITHSANTDEQAATYGYATELLAGNGGANFYMGDDYTNETWFPEYDLQIGSPAGGETVDPDGVHRRAFTGGLVLVNPTTSTQTVSLGGVYSGSGLSAARTATMAPQSGLVLAGATTTNTSTTSTTSSSATTTTSASTTTSSSTRTSTTTKTSTTTTSTRTRTHRVRATIALKHRTRRHVARHSRRHPSHKRRKRAVHHHRKPAAHHTARHAHHTARHARRTATRR